MSLKNPLLLAAGGFAGFLIAARAMTPPADSAAPVAGPVAARAVSPRPTAARVRYQARDDGLWRVGGANDRGHRVAPAGQFECLADDRRNLFLLLDNAEDAGDGGDAGPALVALECDQAGVVLRGARVGGDAVAAATAIEGARLLPDGRVFVELHVNPSAGVGVAVDLAGGRSQAWEGRDFTWDAGGRHVAYFREPMHFAAPEVMPGVSPLARPALSAAVCADGVERGAVPAGSGRGLAWSADGLSLTATVETAAGARAVIVRLGARGGAVGQWPVP